MELIWISQYLAVKENDWLAFNLLLLVSIFDIPYTFKPMFGLSNIIHKANF